MKFRKLLVAAGLAAATFSSLVTADRQLLNVSYDPTREFYREYNALFANYWKEKHGENVTVRQSHGGSGSQARTVIDGLNADVVTLALAYDISAISENTTDLLPTDWQSRLPSNSSPYTSTIVLLVRKDNPKNIKDWDDLIRSDVQVITPNPKTSGGARWNYLAAWGFAKEKYGSDDAAYDFVRKIFANVPVLDSGARGATNTFVQRRIGDVFIAWENEAILSIEQLGRGQFEIVVPSTSILAEPPVTVIDGNAKRKGNEELSWEYLQYLYSPEAQDIVGKHYYRPTEANAVKKYAEQFPNVQLFTINAVFGGWDKAQKEHFNDGGRFDQLMEDNLRNSRR